MSLMPVGGSSARHIQLPNSPLAPRLARQTIRQMLAALGVADSRVDTALLLTSEVVTNALCYAVGDGSGRAVSLEARVVAGTLRVAVHDPDPTVPATRQPGADDERGRGLHIVAAEAKEWGVTITPGGAGKTVWFAVPVLDPVASAPGQALG